MITLLWLLLAILALPFKSERQLQEENIALRHQVVVLRRQVRGRVRLMNLDLVPRSRGGRPAIAADLRALIRQMSIDNPLWGAPRIHGELLKLGFEEAPGYLIRDSDRIYGAVALRRIRASATSL